MLKRLKPYTITNPLGRGQELLGKFKYQGTIWIASWPFSQIKIFWLLWLFGIFGVKNATISLLIKYNCTFLVSPPLWYSNNFEQTWPPPPALSQYELRASWELKFEKHCCWLKSVAESIPTCPLLASLQHRPYYCSPLIQTSSLFPD